MQRSSALVAIILGGCVATMGVVQAVAIHGNNGG